MKKRMFMALAVALTGVSMVVAAGNGELKIQSEASVQKVHAAEIHQLSLIHISEPTRRGQVSRMPSSA